MLNAAGTPITTTGSFNRQTDVVLRLYPTDWAALEPTAGLGTGLLTFTMANTKWG